MKSKTENDEPKRAIPYNDKAAPTRATDRSDKLDPK
jgi:hypothetical protein